MKFPWKKVVLLLLMCGVPWSVISCTSIEAEEPGKESKGLQIEEPVTLTMLYSREDMTWSLLMDDLCSKFESENPDIDIELQDQGDGGYEENLKIKEALDELR